MLTSIHAVKFETNLVNQLTFIGQCY